MLCTTRHLVSSDLNKLSPWTPGVGIDIITYYIYGVVSYIAKMFKKCV